MDLGGTLSDGLIQLKGALTEDPLGIDILEMNSLNIKLILKTTLNKEVVFQ
jgi:hypothetical protein